MKYLTFLLLLVVTIAYGSVNQNAIDTTIKALSLVEGVRDITKDLEDEFYSTIPMDKDTLTGMVTAAATTVAAIDGRIDTSYIKNLKIKALGGLIEPQLIYNMRDNNITTELVYSLDW